MSTNLLSCNNDPRCMHWIYEALDLLVDSVCSTGSPGLISAYGNIKTCFTLKILFLYVWKMHSVAGTHARLSGAFLYVTQLHVLRWSCSERNSEESNKTEGVLLKYGLIHSAWGAIAIACHFMLFKLFTCCLTLGWTTSW